MASPLNTFKSVNLPITTSATTIYTAPAETTTIVLLAQVTNVSTTTNANVAFWMSNATYGNIEIVKNFTVPIGDAADLLTGKLVVEAGQYLGCQTDNNGILKLTLSILETK